MTAPVMPAGIPGMVTIKFESESPSFKDNLNQVSSVSLLMTASTGLTNEGLFELTQRPSRALHSPRALLPELQRYKGTPGFIHLPLKIWAQVFHHKSLQREMGHKREVNQFFCQ